MHFIQEFKNHPYKSINICIIQCKQSNITANISNCYHIITCKSSTHVWLTITNTISIYTNTNVQESLILWRALKSKLYRYSIWLKHNNTEANTECKKLCMKTFGFFSEHWLKYFSILQLRKAFITRWISIEQ